MRLPNKYFKSRDHGVIPVPRPTRQVEYQKLFAAALIAMPTHADDGSGKKTPIDRRVKRSMARELARRNWRDRKWDGQILKLKGTVKGE